ncbi:hypothetical protein UFOVP693_6 [uncultured Caudovirales phage]|uniref:Uncharacterized protein n=1 Tax=uncultured Caudovirales phage TaxID=2100421 RepID=A0A6J5NE09_9CAUD|nr:hypothetical protein UFOVP693_6 [uncultured Caudovirales phage]
MNNYYLNKLNQIKIALGMDVKMVDAVLKDGVTRVSAETLESGSKIYVVAEDGTKAPAPEGIHELEDGTKVYVDAEGTITEVEKPEEEGVEIEIEAAVEEVPAGEKSAEQPTKSEATITKEEMAAYVDSIMEKVMMTIEEVAKEIGSVKEEMASYKSKMEKMSKTPAATKISTFNNEPASPVDAVDARIESLNSLRTELAKTRKF